MSSRAGRAALVASIVGVALLAAATPASAQVAAVNINEIESSGGAVLDFVEVVNNAASPVDLGGYVIKDNDDTHSFTIPAATIVAAGEHYVADVDTGPTAFGLGGADSARLFAPGDLVTPVDSYGWSAHAVATYGRCPNGTGAFTTTTSPTRGAANDCSVAVKINEIESSGGAVSDFAELINNGPTAADVGGWVVKDNDDTHSFTIPAGAMIAAGGYYVADVDTGPTAFGLGSADSARLFAPGDLVTPVDSYSWSAHASTTYGRCPNGTGAFTTTTSPTRGAANDCVVAGPNVKLNELESSGGAVPDFVELINNEASPADVGGYVIKDNDDTHSFTIPAGTTIAAGGYYVADVDTGPTAFGLGAADSARLFAPADLITPVDSYTWSAHATTTYGRCPNGSGAFTTTLAPTRGAVNLCPGDVVALPWPGGTAVSTADGVDVFGTNLSGLAYQPSGTSAPGVLWAVRNGPSTLYRLVYDGAKWTPDTANGWGAGKQLRYADGTGDPDAEGVTLVDMNPQNGVFVSTERNNSASGTSRPAVLRFDVSSAATTLTASADWNLTTDLPALAANAGAEAVAWVPDDFLVAKGFRDELTGSAYDPASYANHGAGLFFVGVEQNGAIYAYALNQTTGAYTRVATVASGFVAVMDLEFEPQTGHLWAACDDTCNGRTATLDIAQTGADDGLLVVTNTYERPTGMPNVNNEGFAIAPRRECSGGKKPVFWSDDNNTDMHALRAGTLDCTDPLGQTITFDQPAAITFGSAPAPLVGSSTSMLPVDFAAAGPCSVAGTVNAPTLTASGAGTCTVTASQDGDATFASATPVVRSVTIDKAPQTITFDQPQPVTAGSAPVALVATATSTLRVSFAAAGPCSVTGSAASPTLTASGAGTCTVTASQAGNANVAAAPDVVRTVTINPAPVSPPPPPPVAPPPVAPPPVAPPPVAPPPVAPPPVAPPPVAPPPVAPPPVAPPPPSRPQPGCPLAGTVIVATSRDDTRTGTRRADIIFGLAGNDVLRGDVEDDCLYGESGNDLLHGDADADRLFGGFGSDDLRGGTGADRLFGEDGADRLAGGPGDDRVDGARGNDALRDDRGEDRLDGGSGNDRVDARDATRAGRAVADTVVCGPGRRDVALADRVDRVARDCEIVRR